MSDKIKQLSWSSLFILFAVLAVGCARTATVSHYQLVAERNLSSLDKAGQGLVIGIGPVRLPEYLDRAQLVSRAGENLLHLDENNRWAEPLAENFARVLAENLSAMRGNGQVLVFPWPSARKVDRQVVVEVVNFENDGSAAVLLKARWGVHGPGGEMLIPEKISIHRAPLPGPGAAQLVAALNAALAGFSRELAAAL